MARTAKLGTGRLVGGMRGSKANELIVLQPRPSLFTVVALNLARLLGQLTGWVARHPSAVTAVVAVTAVWALAGLHGLGVLFALGLAVLWVWRRWHRSSYRRLVVSRWRAFWVYRRRWQPAMHTCGLSAQVGGREYLPRIRRVVADGYVDRVSVDLLSGQAPAKFEASTSQLAHTFTALRCGVVMERPGRIVLEFMHGEPLAEPAAAFDPEPVPDLERLPIGRREDGTPWTHRLIGTHLLVAGATWRVAPVGTGSPRSGYRESA